MKIDLDNGKYTYLINHDGTNQHALRHGYYWRDLTGDNLTLHMAYKIEELQNKINELEKNKNILDIIEKCNKWNVKVCEKMIPRDVILVEELVYYSNGDN